MVEWFYVTTRLVKQAGFTFHVLEYPENLVENGIVKNASHR